MNDFQHKQLLIETLRGVISLARIEQKFGSKIWGDVADSAELAIKGEWPIAEMERRHG